VIDVPPHLPTNLPHTNNTKGPGPSCEISTTFRAIYHTIR
jgi:hypothetical protein